MEQIHAGQVVRLRSGGPAMTVQSVDNNYAHCVWFDGNTLRKGDFEVRSLQPSE